MENRILYIQYLRVIAMFMIVYDHLGAFRNQEWIVAKFFDFYFNKPLGLIQDFGALGVSIFYIISGFLLFKKINESPNLDIKKYFKKKLKILYIPVILSGILFLCLQKTLFYLFRIGGYWEQFEWIEWIKSITLLHYILKGNDIIIGVTWFLIPLFIFYLYIFCFLNIGIENLSRLSYLFNIVNILNIIIFYKCENLYVNNYMYYFCFANICIIGGELYLLLQKMKCLNIFLIIFTWINIINTFYLFANPYFEDDKYLVSTVVGICMFVLFYLYNYKLKENKFISNLDKYSYEIYLIHMTFGSMILGTLEKSFDYSFIFSITLILIYFLAIQFFKFKNFILRLI